MLRKRIWALVVKELLTLFRDKRVRIILVAPPLLQLFVFSFAVTLEVKNVSLAVCNQDMGRHGSEIVQRLCASPTFSRISFVNYSKEFHALLDQQMVLAVLHIPQDFSRSIEEGGEGRLQVILDGRRSNAAQIVNGYITQLVMDYTRELRRSFSLPSLPVLAVSRNWFNENLLYLWFTVPSLVALLALLMSLMITALSVSREKELGTFDQLLVSPLMPHEILIGKTIPAVLVGLGEASLILTTGIFLLRVPFTGSLILLFLVMAVFVASLVGVGLFISSLAKTQQQAILGVFVFMVPAVTLSGFSAPVENMPTLLQYATWINPLKHALIMVRGLFLKEMPLVEIWLHLWPLFVIGGVTLGLASWFFVRRLE